MRRTLLGEGGATAGWPPNPPQSSRFSGGDCGTKLKRWTETAVVGPEGASCCGKISRCAAVLAVVGRANQTILILLKIKMPPCHFARVISRQTSSANVRSHGVDRARRGESYLSHKRHTAATVCIACVLGRHRYARGGFGRIGVAFQ
jgi:hypothetical protein